MRNDQNLLKLADYLDSLPDDYEHFSMFEFFRRGTGASVSRASTRAQINRCGTVACAVGHGPSAGIAPQPGEYWRDYTGRVFTDSWDEFDWCFHAAWTRIDDTPKGAAKRIRHLVKHGLPYNAYLQMRGEKPYMFEGTPQ